MKKINELKEMLCEELDRLTTEASKSKLTQTNLDVFYKLTDTIKNIDKIEMLEDGGYSEAGMWSARIDGEYGDQYAYERGNSRARNRGGYSRDMSMRGGNSYRRGYSRDDAKEDMVEQLEDMMYSADDSKTKEAIKRCMESLKQM